MMRNWVLLVSSLFLSNVLLSTAVQCGQQADGALCPGDLCCSKWGYCGSTDLYCLVEKGCQSNCKGDDDTDTPPSPDIDAGPLGDIITRDAFNEMLIFRNQDICPAAGFYTYDDFIAAAKSFPAFGSTGDLATRKREVAAFLGQTSYETAGEWSSDDQYIWGYCINKDIDCDQSYCRRSRNFPCIPGQSYCGRGPIQLSWNTNYGQFGQSIGRKDELLQNPDILINNATMSFESVFWYWMTPQSNSRVSCHDVMVGSWRPSIIDTLLGRLPGYGASTNLLNGVSECGKGPNVAGKERIGYYKRYCDVLGVSYGENLDCYYQTPFSYVSAENSM